MSKKIFSNEAFADWCEKQGDRTYLYIESRDCAIYQYLISLGLPVFSVCLNRWSEKIETKDGPNYVEHEFPDIWRELANPAHPGRDTFRNLAVRLRGKAHAI